VDARHLRLALLFIVLAGALTFMGARAYADTNFKLESTAVVANGSFAAEQIYNDFGCRGGNVSPPLRWSGAPRGAKSFAVTMYDPDAPGGSGWWHWAIYDIPAAVTALPPGAGNPGGQLPPGAAQGRTDFGFAAYGGPCPPSRDKPHRYVLTLYALGTEHLSLPAGAAAREVDATAKAQSLAAASFTALYGR
jgi:Raf kinase inhibitor-like YbhB/YbcL family protein